MYGKRNLEDVQDLEMGSLSWLIQIGPKCDHRYHYKREVEEDFTTKEEGMRYSPMMTKDARLLALKMEEKATSQGMQGLPF